MNKLETQRPAKGRRPKSYESSHSGTLTDEALLDDRSDSLLAALNRVGDEFGIATLDMSSGQFQLMEVSSQEELHSELQRLNPVEILISEDLSGLDFLKTVSACAGVALGNSI